MRARMALRIVMLGVDIDATKALARWAAARWDDEAFAGLATPIGDGELRPPASPRIDELHLTIRRESAEQPLAEAAALAAETIWNRTPYPALAHVAQPEHHVLYQASLVVDVRCDLPADQRRTDLAMEMPFLCPDAPLVVHEPDADVATELDEALAVGTGL